MTDEADDLDRRLTRLFKADRREDPREHPAPEKLSAYHAKELPPPEADAIQEHLIQCAFCTDLLLDLQSFLEPEEEDQAREGVADLGAEAGWRKVRGEMGWSGRQEGAAEASRLRRSLRAFQALAAVLLVGVVGLSFYSFRILREMKAPEANSISAFLASSEGVRSSAVEPELIVLPQGEEKSIAFTLDGDDVDDFPEYRAEIRRKQEEVFLTVSGLRRQPDGFNFKIGSHGLKSGIYEIELYGLGNGSPAREGYYAFQIERK